MNSGSNQRSQAGLHQLAALGRNAEITADKRLRRSRSQADNHLRPYTGDLGVEPGSKSSYLLGIGFLVNSQLASRREIEMLPQVGNINFSPSDASLLHPLTQKFPRR